MQLLLVNAVNENAQFVPVAKSVSGNLLLSCEIVDFWIPFEITGFFPGQKLINM